MILDLFIFGNWNGYGIGKGSDTHDKDHLMKYLAPALYKYF